MKMNFKHLVVAATIPFALSAVAADLQITGTFKTIKDVTITQVAGHEMTINGLQMASGSSCTVTTPTVGANWGGDVLMLASTTGTQNAQATYGATAGAGCSTGTSVPGVYEIDGASGASVNITLADTASGGISFSPDGCAIDYNGAADGDVCTAVAANSTQAITLANTGDETVSAGNGQPVAGKSRLVIGGDVTSTIGLTAATAYNVPFDIVVTY